MSITVFLSTVSDEFRSYRDQLESDLTRQNVAVKVQERFKDLGSDTLDKLDKYIVDCDAVVHLVGDMCGAVADAAQQRALLARYLDIEQRLPALSQALKTGVAVSYTHWEAWLALYHCKQLYIAEAAHAEQRGPNYKPTDESRAAQAAHLARLREAKVYPFEFTTPDNLAKQVLASGILDLLVKDYARQEGRGRAVAEGFIDEMAKRVAGDKALDLEGKQQAVRNAIEIYVNEIAGTPATTNFDDIVNRALARAKEQVDRGQSGLARATLRRAAEEMNREEEERRERYVASLTALYYRECDIALAAYEGDAAAEAIIELGRSIHRENAAKIAEFIGSEAEVLYEYGGDRGSNVHLVAAIALRRELLRLTTAHERGVAQNNLGLALWRLGERESGTARLQEAIKAYRAALEEETRERVPLLWACAQTNLGLALCRLGEREGGTARLEEAVEAYRAALEEMTREGAPLDWATTQNNLGNALATHGARESGTDMLEEAVAAYREALKERTRGRVPLDWAATQNNLGNALKTLGDRDTGTARLEEAVQAYRAALEEYKCERVPLDWATTQSNLGNALISVGERESGTARLDEAVQAYRAALEERTRERVPLDWAASFGSQGVAMMLIADRTNDGALAETAVRQMAVAYEALRDGGQEAWAAMFEAQLTSAQAIRDRLKDK
jgi:tetratricopeptide (TPR) repeat protein